MNADNPTDNPTTAWEAARRRTEQGLLVQNACNPLGVAHELLRQLGELRAEHNRTPSRLDMSTDPGVVLVIAKLADMAGIDVSWTDGPVAAAYKRAR